MDRESCGVFVLPQLVEDEFVQVAFTDVPLTPQVTELDEEAALYGKHASKLSCTGRLNVA